MVADGTFFAVPQPRQLSDGSWLIGFLKLGGMQPYAALFIVDGEQDAVDAHRVLRGEPTVAVTS